ncbi:hypothetical protein [Saccharibacillus kuerlensis]|uniref:Uncharacterized protein n=1 Tax=Saccharibacillus kuerlensis TaxID=459527 RepID=A0ABQ2L098_9BACL|nr:hypothetical protein [Saccharibacillus kuerlensis]GGN98368.1 hypothetical protein GCM10010969_17400 [Saccharibacillus kuerlensis]
MDKRKKQLRLQQKMIFDVLFVILAIAAIFFFELHTFPAILLPLLLAVLRGYTFFVNLRHFRRLSAEIRSEQRPKSRLYEREEEL